MSATISATPQWLAKPRSTVLIVAVPAGSADDVHRGTAHLVEHLVLRRCHDPNAVWEANGLTSERVTMFECVTTPEHLDVARARLRAAVFEPLRVALHEIDSELQVIDIESSAERTSTEILGTAAERAEITASDVLDFHRRHYRPEAAYDVVVSGDMPFVHEQVPPVAPCHTSLSRGDIHVRMSEDLTQIVLTQKGRSAEGAALLLDIARRVDPLLVRRLTLPVETGHRRLRVAGPGQSLVVSVHLTVRPTVTALAFSIAGGSDPKSRSSWIRDHLRERSDPTPYEWADPVLQARWQAFWDLSVDGGHARLREALEADSTRFQEGARRAASQIEKALVGAHV